MASSPPPKARRSRWWPPCSFPSSFIATSTSSRSIARWWIRLQTAVVMLLVAASALVGVFLTESQLPQNLAKSIVGITSNPYMVLLLLNIFFLILGMFLHSAAAIILTVPIVMPLVHQVGIDPIHFGLVLTLNLAIGQQTPPVASVLIAACSIAKSDIWETTKANFGFITVLVGVLMLCSYVPWFSLVLIRVFRTSISSPSSRKPFGLFPF